MTESEHLGMPSPSFASHQLREARSEAVSLAAKNERLVKALGLAREQIAELGAQLDAVTFPPVTYALLTGVVERPLRDAAEGDVTMATSMDV